MPSAIPPTIEPLGAGPRAFDPPGPARTVPPETARAFEAMLLRPMVDAMVPRGGAMGEGTGSGAWRDMLVGALSDEVARSGAIGLHALLPDTLTGAGE